nr:MAG TPA: hypothetical protein [Caudoviricetes sp.]
MYSKSLAGVGEMYSLNIKSIYTTNTYITINNPITKH